MAAREIAPATLYRNCFADTGLALGEVRAYDLDVQVVSHRRVPAQLPRVAQEF